MNCKCNVIILILAFISSAHCQETIPGSVFDGDTKQGIPYAAVHLMGSYSGTSCNEAGQFVLHVPKGKEHSKVVVSSMGYSSDTVSVQALLKKKGKVVLKPNAIQLSGVTITEYATARKLMDAVIKRIPQNYRTEDAIGIWSYRDKKMLNDSLFIQSEGLARSYMPAYGKMLSVDYYRDSAKMSESVFRLYQCLDTMMVYNKAYWRSLIGMEELENWVMLEKDVRPSDFRGAVGSDFVNHMRGKSIRMFSRKSKFTMEIFSQDGKDYYRVTIAYRPRFTRVFDTATLVITKDELAIVDAVVVSPERSSMPKIMGLDNYLYVSDMIFASRAHWRYHKYNGKYQLDFSHVEYENRYFFSEKARAAGCRVSSVTFDGSAECILSEYTTEGVEDYRQRYYDNEHPRTEENLQETERILRQPHNKIPW